MLIETGHGIRYYENGPQLRLFRHVKFIRICEPFTYESLLGHLL